MKAFIVPPHTNQGLYPERKSHSAVCISGKIQICEKTLVGETQPVEGIFAFTQKERKRNELNNYRQEAHFAGLLREWKGSHQPPLVLAHTQSHTPATVIAVLPKTYRLTLAFVYLRKSGTKKIELILV